MPSTKPMVIPVAGGWAVVDPHGRLIDVAPNRREAKRIAEQHVRDEQPVQDTRVLAGGPWRRRR